MDTGTAQLFVEPECKNRLKLTLDINAVRWQELEDQQRQIECHLKAEREDAKWESHERRDDVKIDGKLDAYWNELNARMTLFESMRDGHLRLISVEKHRIDCKSIQTRPMQCAQ